MWRSRRLNSSREVKARDFLNEEFYTIKEDVNEWEL
jgi:hypothetical protein